MTDVMMLTVTGGYSITYTRAYACGPTSQTVCFQQGTTTESMIIIENMKHFKQWTANSSLGYHKVDTGGSETTV